MSFDNLCKLLAEKNPEVFTEWLIGYRPNEVSILKPELSIEPIRADSVTFLKAENRILHIEFQTLWPSKPPMPLRMLDYWVRLHRFYGLPITQIVVVLLPPSDNTTIESAFHFENTHHEFTVIKMWEQDTALFLENPVLLPFAALTQREKSEALLNQVAQKLDTIESIEQKREISSYVQLMAGLKYDKDSVRRIFREGIMRESVIYQEILQEGEVKGRRILQREMVLGMLNEGISIETIARLTQLSISDIQQIQLNP
jgi:predicted transposase/invertase (TIGR01784 family)